MGLFDIFKKKPQPAGPINFPNDPRYYQRVQEMANDPRRGGIIFVGDSITESWLANMPEIFNDNIRNFGIAGDTTVGVAKRIGTIIQAEPQKLFIKIGTNNLGAGIVADGKGMYYTQHPDLKKVVDQLVIDYHNILSAIKLSLPGCKIHVQSILPVSHLPFPNQDQVTFKLLQQRKNVDTRNVNEILKVLANQCGCGYIDLYSQFAIAGDEMDPNMVFDGLHLNKLGHQKWWQLIQPQIYG